MSVQFGEKLGWQTELTANDNSPKEMLGIRRIELGDGGRKVYVYVKNAEESAALAAGQVVKWDDASSGEVKKASATGDLLAGVAIGAITAGNYGWVQVFGLATVLTASGTAAGDAVIASGSAGVGGKVTKGTAPTNQVLGWARDAQGAGGTNTVFLVLA
jgi:hypothetical protein